MPDENLMAMTLKSQQSAFVKEKIKEILEDGQKKTFITLRSCESSQVENRISVIKSISSTINCDDQLRSSSSPSSFEISAGYTVTV